MFLLTLFINIIVYCSSFINITHSYVYSTLFYSFIPLPWICVILEFLGSLSGVFFAFWTEQIPRMFSTHKHLLCILFSPLLCMCCIIWKCNSLLNWKMFTIYANKLSYCTCKLLNYINFAGESLGGTLNPFMAKRVSEWWTDNNIGLFGVSKT